MNEQKKISLTLICGKNIRHFRKAAKLRLIDLQGLTGLSKTTLVAIEQGKNQSLETLEKIAVALNVEPAMLVKYNEWDRPKNRNLGKLLP